MADHSRCQVNCGSTDCRVPWGQVLHDAALRRAKIVRPEPDCRTCANHVACVNTYPEQQTCVSGDRYQPLPPVRLWRKT